MTLIADGLLRSDSFKVSPEFLRKLVTERLERDSQYHRQLRRRRIALRAEPAGACA